MRTDPSNFTLVQEASEGSVRYRTRVAVSGAGQVSYQADDLIYSSTATGEKAVFYCELFQNMEERFGANAARGLVEEVMLVFGAVTFLESCKREGRKVNAEQPAASFPLEMPFYAELVDIDRFSLAISFITARPATLLELTFSIASALPVLPIGQFHQRQRALTSALPGITGKLTAVQNLIYQIDTADKLGRGSYGSVFRCDSLQLLDQSISGERCSFCFRRRALAIKQLTLTPEEQHALQIPVNREHLVLSLIGELRHREAIKDLTRGLGLQVEASLVGLDHIVPLVEFFKVEQKGREEHFFLSFELGQASLSSK